MGNTGIRPARWIAFALAAFLAAAAVRHLVWPAWNTFGRLSARATVIDASIIVVLLGPSLWNEIAGLNYSSTGYGVGLTAATVALVGAGIAYRGVIDDDD